MLRIVLDTVVFVRSLINPHSICGKIVFYHNKSYQLFVSELVFTEVIEVLKRPELTNKFSVLKNMDLSEIIDLLGLAQVVEIPEIPTVSRDPKDDKFLATALAAKADYLISEDTDLLDLKEYKKIKIVNSETFIRILTTPIP